MNRGMVIYDQIKEIENAEPQRVRRKTENSAFELRLDDWLIDNLSGNYGALFIRAMLYWLDIDEFYVLKWRLENKYKQYQVLCYYYPHCVPKTFGLSSFLMQSNGVEKIKTLFQKGYFLKATLGDASYTTKSWDKTGRFDEILHEQGICSSVYEKYMIQERLQIKSEFRIHSFYRDIIPCLTYLTQGNSQYREGAEDFLNKVLNNLPDTILQGTLIGWDIAVTHNDLFYVIEANFTGYHPEYRKGFQTSGFFDDHQYGSIICAWLNVYFRKLYGVYADSVEQNLFAHYPFYRSFIYYMSILKEQHLALVRKRSKAVPLSFIIYLGEVTNTLMVYLIKHFLLVDFADKYIVIVRDENIGQVYNMFSGNIRIQFYLETWLFNKDQYQVVKQLSYQRRKCMCCYQALRRNRSSTIL